MIAMKLVDNSDRETCYGILICDNDQITRELIQNKILEIKDKLLLAGEDWIIEDVIGSFPEEWSVSLQKQYDKVEI